MLSLRSMFSKTRQKMGGSGWKGMWGGVEGGEPICIYCMRKESLFNKRKKIRTKTYYST